MYHREVIDQLAAILEGSDKRRKRWVWAMPRDQWLMFREVTGEDHRAPLIRPSASWPHGTMMGYPVVVDDTALHVELRAPEDNG